VDVASEESDDELKDDVDERDEDESEVLSEDSFDMERKEEEFFYDVDNDEADAKPGEVDELEEVDEFAWSKENPTELSYWKDRPPEDVIGLIIKKKFNVHGWYRGKVVTFKKPFYLIRYKDGDEEEMSLKEVIALLDMDRFRRSADLKEREEEDVDYNELDILTEDERADSKGGVQGRECIDDADDDDNDNDDEDDEDDDDDDKDEISSMASEEPSPIKEMSREECEMNDILKIQEILINLLYDIKNSPSKFNKVNDGKVVDMALALHLLHFIETSHMSRSEADAYLKSQHKYTERLTRKPFDMVKSYKTLKRVLLQKVDQKIPLGNCEVSLPQEYFCDLRTSRNRPLPALHAAYIPLEVALGILLLKISTNDIIHEMKARYWRGVNESTGEESVERIYTDWSSSKYACDIQEVVRGGDFVCTPLVLYVSIFVDGGVMNSSQTRKAVPVTIAIQNVRKEKFQSLIGFVPEESTLSEEILDGLLETKGYNKTSREFILQYAHRQRLWDYLHGVFTPFLERQNTNNGYDVQIGTGMNKKYYKVFVVFTNFLGDCPQMHDLTSVTRSGCHLCMAKNFANFRINTTSQPRKLEAQIKAGVNHAVQMTKFINRIDNTRQAIEDRVRAKELLKDINGYSGRNKVNRIFNLVLENGKLGI
jgi:hypothetical protein